MTSAGNIPVICEEGYASRVSRSSSGWGRSLNDYDLSEVLNPTSSSSIDSLDLLSRKYILDLKGTKLYAEDSIRRLRFL